MTIADPTPKDLNKVLSIIALVALSFAYVALQALDNADSGCSGKPLQTQATTL